MKRCRYWMGQSATSRYRRVCPLFLLNLPSQLYLRQKMMIPAIQRKQRPYPHPQSPGDLNLQPKLLQRV